MRNSLLTLSKLFVCASLALMTLVSSAQTQKKITLDKDNVPVESVLDDIEHQTNYLFVC